MADADRALASARDQDAYDLPALRSEPRCAALVRQRVGMSRLSRSRVRLPTSAALLSGHSSACAIATQARSRFTTRLARSHASRSNRATGSGDARALAASERRSQETEAALCRAS